MNMIRSDQGIHCSTPAQPQLRKNNDGLSSTSSIKVPIPETPSAPPLPHVASSSHAIKSFLVLRLFPLVSVDIVADPTYDALSGGMIAELRRCISLWCGRV